MALEFQAFIDDSYSKDEFVLAGYIAPAAVWLHFVNDWDEQLRFGTRAKNGEYHFKMTEMARTGMDRVPIFYNVIEKYPELYPVSFRMNLQDFQQAQARIEALGMKLRFNIDLGPWKNKFFFAFHGLIENFHKARQNLVQHIPPDERVDFIFDTQSEEALLPPWNEFVLSNPEAIQQFYGAKPRFEDDQEFLALQAADLWAWWVRKWYDEDNIDVPDKMRALDFGGKWKGNLRKKLTLAISEDQIFDKFQAIVMESLPHATRWDFYGPA
jgi:hypothetical protein